MKHTSETRVACATDGSAATGAATYGGVLATAGGLEVEAFRRGSTPASLTVVLYASPPYAMAVPAINTTRLSINLSDSPVTGGLDGDRSRVFQARRHSLFLTPAGAGAYWRKERPSRHINVYFDSAAARNSEGIDLDAVSLLNASVPQARPLIDMLAIELVGHNPFAAEAVDSLARLILVQIARKQMNSSQPLTPALMGRIAEFVDAGLDQRLLVSDMAAVVGLTPNRFAQAFARATSRSPHQYVLDRRLERATDLLRSSSEPLAEIAAACGFANQQHMTQLMRRRVGTTPARYREGAC